MGIKLEAEAYCVLMLHAVKHAAKAVNGLLIGQVNAAGDVIVSRSLPLFHSSFALAPMLEVALMLADEFCQKSGDMQIVGYYQANELSGDMDLGPFGRKIAEKIRAQCAKSIVLLVDGSKMKPSARDLRLLAMGAEGKVSSQEIAVSGDADKAIEQLELCISRGAQQRLVDFDAHLDDSSKDWLNTQVLAC